MPEFMTTCTISVYQISVKSLHFIVIFVNVHNRAVPILVHILHLIPIFNINFVTTADLQKQDIIAYFFEFLSINLLSQMYQLEKF